VNFKDHNSAKKAIDEINLKLKIENSVLLVSPHIYRKESDLNPKGTSTNPIV
jgi:RNA recognition motif-containing protein